MPQSVTLSVPSTRGNTQKLSPSDCAQSVPKRKSKTETCSKKPIAGPISEMTIAAGVTTETDAQRTRIPRMAFSPQRELEASSDGGEAPPPEVITLEAASTVLQCVSRQPLPASRQGWPPCPGTRSAA